MKNRGEERVNDHFPSILKITEATMGVMTTKEFGMENEQNKTNPDDKKDKPTSKTKDVEIKDIYECHFSINIMKQKIQQGIPCVE